MAARPRKRTRQRRATHVVAFIGSAGSFAALVHELQALRADGHTAFFFAYHRSRAAMFSFPPLFTTTSGLRFVAAKDGDLVLADRVYGPSDGRDVSVVNGHVVLTDPASAYHPNLDHLLSSLARSFGRNAMAVVLSGAGDDGVDGAGAVRAANGCVIVQDPAEAQFPQLPADVIQSGHAYLSVPVGDLARVIDFVRRGRRRMVQGS